MNEDLSGLYPGCVVDLTLEELERAPHYALEDMRWADPKYGHSVYDRKLTRSVAGG